MKAVTAMILRGQKARDREGSEDHCQEKTENEKNRSRQEQVATNPLKNKCLACLLNSSSKASTVASSW